VLAREGEHRATGTAGVAGSYAELETDAHLWGIVPAGGGREWIYDKRAAEAAARGVQHDNDARLAPAAR
jgi:hypothetical protein